MTGYTRQSTAGIQDGAVISANDLNNEFDLLATSFASGGHNHDGSPGEGPQITSAGLAAGAVIESKILNGAVTTGKINDLAVTNAKLAADAVTGAKIDETTTITAASFVGPLTGDVTGAVTGDVTGNVTGNVTGDITGNVTGDLTGDVTGNVTGDLTGDVTGNVTGNLTGDVTGAVTGNVTGDLTGNVTGNVTGNLTGDVTGDVTGNLTGDVTGNITGDLTGDVSAALVDSDAYTENTVSLSGTTPAVDMTAGSVFTLSLTGASTFTFSNPPTTGTAQGFTVVITQNASSTYAVTWPSSVYWVNGSPPAMTAITGAVDVYTFFTHDGGTTYYGFAAGQNMS